MFEKGDVVVGDAFGNAVTQHLERKHFEQLVFGTQLSAHATCRQRGTASFLLALTHDAHGGGRATVSRVEEPPPGPQD